LSDGGVRALGAVEAIFSERGRLREKGKKPWTAGEGKGRGDPKERLSPRRRKKGKWWGSRKGNLPPKDGRKPFSKKERSRNVIDPGNGLVFEAL